MTIKGKELVPMESHFSPTFDLKQFELYPAYRPDRLAKFAFAQHLKAQKAVGKTLKVRIGGVVPAEGVITKAAYYRLRNRGKSLVVLFVVELATTFGSKYRIEVGCLPR